MGIEFSQHKPFKGHPDELGEKTTELRHILDNKDNLKPGAFKIVDVQSGRSVEVEAKMGKTFLKGDPKVKSLKINRG